MALVDGEKILKSDFEKRLAAQIYFYTTISPLPEEEISRLEERVREEMIQELLLTQLLAEHGITVTDEEVRQRIQEIGKYPLTTSQGICYNRNGEEAIARIRYEHSILNAIGRHYGTNYFTHSDSLHLKRNQRITITVFLSI